MLSLCVPVFIYFQLKDNCFTVLCWFLPYINKNQPWVQTCPLPFKPPSHRTPHPISLGCHRAPVWIPWIIQQIPTVCASLDQKLSLQLWDYSWTGWELKATDITKWAITGRLSIVNHIEVYSHLLCSLFIWALPYFFEKLLLCHFSSPVDRMMEWWRVSLEPVCLGLYWLRDLRQDISLLYASVSSCKMGIRKM